jgi:hypothetical protein
VRYAYYAKLKPKEKAIYRRSDAIETIGLPAGPPLTHLIRSLEGALESEQRTAVERAARALCDALLGRLAVPRLRIKVLSKRPSTSTSELHGLYEPAEPGARAVVTVWMRTAHHQRVVAFRTFLRTLLHELCHHLDYELLRLPDSFHTEGFFKRESSLFRQLVGVSRRPRAAASESRSDRR